MERRRTMCPLDCWDGCGIIATVDGDRIIRLDGDPDDPVARGKLCARTYRYPERAQSHDRIRTPMRREADGSFRPADWEVALAEIAGRFERLREDGRTHSILHVQSAGSMGVLKTLSARFWNLLGGVTYAEGDVCLGAGKTALTHHLGDYRAHDWDDLRNSRLVLLWGRDPFVSGPHRLAALREAQRRGARIVSINPLVLTRSSILDESIVLRPGSDAFLAAALAQVLVEEERIDADFLAAHTSGFDVFLETLRRQERAELARLCGLPEVEIRRLAHLYADAQPAAIVMGTGPIRYRLGLEAASLLTALPALAGYYGVAGGGLSYTVRHLRETAVDREASPDPNVRMRPVSAGAWHHRIARLDPPIDTLWVNGANPVAMLPDSEQMVRAIASVPFKIVVDFHWTDTARVADWVLPHPSFLEEEGVVTSWGTPFVGYQHSVAPRVGEPRTDLEIFQALADRLGFGDAMAGSAETWSRRLMGDRMSEAEWRRVLDPDGGKIRARVHEPVPYAGGAFATADGRYRFPASLPDAGELPRTDAEFPFLLLTPKSRERHLSQVTPSREPHALRGTMARNVAAVAGRSDGMFRLRSRLGSVPVWLREDDELQDDVIVVPLGGTYAKGTTVNLLVGPDCARDDVTPAYFDCPVRIEPA